MGAFAVMSSSVSPPSMYSFVSAGYVSASMGPQSAQALFAPRCVSMGGVQAAGTWVTVFSPPRSTTCAPVVGVAPAEYTSMLLTHGPSSASPA